MCIHMKAYRCIQPPNGRKDFLNTTIQSLLPVACAAIMKLQRAFVERLSVGAAPCYGRGLGL